MKFKAPSSYTKEPGILTLEDGDPDIDEIKRVFRKNGLEVTPKGFLGEWEVTIAKSKGFFEKIFIAVISQASYIYVQGNEAVNELKNS